jgi:hypothetical protein
MIIHVLSTDDDLYPSMGADVHVTQTTQPSLDHAAEAGKPDAEACTPARLPILKSMIQKQYIFYLHTHNLPCRWTADDWVRHQFYSDIA